MERGAWSLDSSCFSYSRYQAQPKTTIRRTIHPPLSRTDPDTGDATSSSGCDFARNAVRAHFTSLHSSNHRGGRAEYMVILGFNLCSLDSVKRYDDDLPMSTRFLA